MPTTRTDNNQMAGPGGINAKLFLRRSVEGEGRMGENVSLPFCRCSLSGRVTPKKLQKHREEEEQMKTQRERVLHFFLT